MSENDHYFTARPASAEDLRELTVRLAGRTVTVHTASGIFSPERVDQGTEVLLRQVPSPPLGGDLLDLGCGWGPLALTLGLLSPGATIWAVDVNERALDLTRRNAESWGLGDFRACRPQDVPPGQQFDVIWSNPPIRVGKATLHNLLRTWLTRLKPGGTAYLVASKNLGSDSLQRWLAAELDPTPYAVSRLASDRGFRVLEVRRAG